MNWYEKHKPDTLDDYVWTDPETKKMLEQWIADPLGHPHLILAGPTGTGKTTLTNIIRTTLDLGGDVKFIPASLQSGVETIREKIVRFCDVGGFNMKLIIMDEADRLSRDALEMLRSVLDRYQEDVRFIFTCNYPDRISSPVKGRSWLVEIDALDEEQFLGRLVDIIAAEDIDVSSEASEARLMEIVESNYPNMRHAITELQMSSMTGELIKPPSRLSSVPWATSMVNQMKEFNLEHARGMVNSIRVDDIELAYQLLYQNSQIYGENEGEAILIIAEYLHRHSQAGLPDITLCACLIKLSEL